MPRDRLRPRGLGKAGDVEDGHIGPVRPESCSQLVALHARHDHVGNEQA